MEKARVLTLEEITGSGKRVIWLEMREMKSGPVPVTLYAERAPFLRFDCETFPAMFEVRAEYYGKTWRCWSAFHAGWSLKDWEELEEDSVPEGVKRRSRTENGKRQR